MNVKSKVPILLEVLDNYDLQNLIDFFEAQWVFTGAHNPSYFMNCITI